MKRIAFLIALTTLPAYASVTGYFTGQQHGDSFSNSGLECEYALGNAGSSDKVWVKLHGVTTCPYTVEVQ